MEWYSLGYVRSCEWISGTAFGIYFDSIGAPLLFYADDNFYFNLVRWTGVNWSPVVTPFFTAGSNRPSIVFDANGFPAIAVAINYPQYKISVFKWDGANWNNIGTPIITKEVGFFNYQSYGDWLKVDANGNYYLAFA